MGDACCDADQKYDVFLNHISPDGRLSRLYSFNRYRVAIDGEGSCLLFRSVCVCFFDFCQDRKGLCSRRRRPGLDAQLAGRQCSGHDHHRARPAQASPVVVREGAQCTASMACWVLYCRARLDCKGATPFADRYNYYTEPVNQIDITKLIKYYSGYPILDKDLPKNILAGEFGVSTEADLQG